MLYRDLRKQDSSIPLFEGGRGEFDFLVGKILRIVSECFHSYSMIFIQMMSQKSSLMQVSVCEQGITVLIRFITLSVSDDH